MVSVIITFPDFEMFGHALPVTACWCTIIQHIVRSRKKIFASLQYCHHIGCLQFQRR